MANAYTPGLKVSSATKIVKQRRLPILGELFVSTGDSVLPETIVARALIPGNPQSVPVAAQLGCESSDIHDYMLIEMGDTVHKGDLIATRKSLFGLLKNDSYSNFEGVVEMISKITGQVIIREPATPIELQAYISGTVIDVQPNESVTIETRGAFIQGIFGVGGERLGVIRMMGQDTDFILGAEHIDDSCEGFILAGGSLVTKEAVQKAADVGAVGIVSGGIVDTDLTEFLGFDIGVAITGHEDIPLTIILTEGFGHIPMAKRTFELLKSLEGQRASINGATQIRAGVMRPEIIVPGLSGDETAVETDKSGTIEIGDRVRLIREPYFGLLATVTALPPELAVIETGAKVRVMEVKLDSGEQVTVPRANVEVMLK